jgi:hypothetical protein
MEIIGLPNSVKKEKDLKMAGNVHNNNNENNNV